MGCVIAIAVLQILVGASFIVLNFKYRFGERFYEYSEGYKRGARTHLKRAGDFMQSLENSLKDHPGLFDAVADPRRRYVPFFQVIYYLMGSGLIYLGISRLASKRTDISIWEILVPCIVLMFALQLLLVKKKQWKKKG